MTKVRVHKTGNFTIMSNYHFKEREMSLKAKGLLSLMLSLPDTWNYSVSGLVTLSKDGKDGVMTALAELEKFGYLTRERLVNEKGQFSGIEYNIYEQPQKENPTAENPITEISATENPPLLSTNEFKNKELKTDNNFIYIEEMLNNLSDWELKELYEDYIEMRESIDAPINEKGLKLLIKRNERLTNGDKALQKALLEAAILNQWKSVYLPNEQDTNNNTHIAERKRFYGV
jgi:hypothetical protein